MARIGVFILGCVLLMAGRVGPEIQTPDPASPSLASVIASAREYCAKLERAALDFVCFEEVEERLDLSLDDRKGLERRVRTATIRDAVTQKETSSIFIVRRNPKQKNAYLYDYQFIRREGQVEEKRVLLKKNGKKADPTDPAPRLGAFTYSEVLMAPVRLLDEEFEAFYSYRLMGPGTASGMDAWIIEVVPRLADGPQYLGGKIWLKRDDASVLRIEWDPATFGHYEEIVARAEIFKAKPEVRSITEFGFKKNGIRFPSSDLTEEGYREAGEKPFVRARTEITYRGYKFFMVETSSTFKK